MQLYIMPALLATVLAMDRCVQFSTVEQSMITSTCGSAVDYTFYLRNSSTLSTLETAARLLLADSEFLFLSSECLVNYKKLVCSNIYLKCQPGVDLLNTTTFNRDIYKTVSFPVPFTRPCKQVLFLQNIIRMNVAVLSCSAPLLFISFLFLQVCTNVAETCSGLINPNCSARFDYSFGQIVIPTQPLQYDNLNDPGKCNIVPSAITVASSAEPYLYKENGACAGLITEIYIPPGSLIAPSFSYITPKYAVQSIIESILVANFKMIPVYTSDDCHLAFRKYFCGSYL